MMFWIVLTGSVVFCYCIFLMLSTAFAKSLPATQYNEKTDWPQLAVLVSVYNGEKDVQHLFTFLKAQQYPPDRWKLYITDDGSTDNTFNSISKYKTDMPCSVEFFQNVKPLGKKFNIQFMAEHLTSKWILTLDSDGFSEYASFLKSRVHFAETHHLDFSAGAISYVQGTSNLLYHFQCTEHAVLHILTQSAFHLKKPYLCSGANLLYKTEVFHQVGGLKSHMHISSGDDVLLLNAFQKHGRYLGFDAQQESMVKVLAPQTGVQFWKQKIRWASKSKYNTNSINTIIACGVWLTSLIVLILPIMFWNSEFKSFVFFILGLKISTEYAVYQYYLYQNNQVLAWRIIPVLVLAFYPFYVVTMGLFSMLSSVTQKTGSRW